ncbi:PhzA/PhzB family protein [Chryseolinea sp. T2]|uniref:nuclear transport factor 2 family protein n=1 Tax=Chryseolinea sp. T2 TaxID=3129255 RepID=UPI00307841B2
MEHSIIEHIIALFSGADERNWTKVKSVLSQQVVLDYSSMTGAPATSVSPEQIVASWSSFLPGFNRTNHHLFDFKVDRKDREAVVTYGGKADHYLNESVWTVEGTYTTEVKLINGIWLITSHTFHFHRQSGDTTLPGLAQANMAIRMVVQKNREVVNNFFVALETQRFELLKEVFDENGKQLNPYSPGGFPKSFDGAEGIYKQYSGLTANFGQMKFPRRIFATEDPNFFFVTFKGEIEIKAGGKYENDYLGTFRLSNGKVIEYTEYFNQVVMAKAFNIDLRPGD